MSRRRSGPTRRASATCFGTRVESPTHSLRELRSLQDWFIRYQLNAVPGVAEVASVGGYVQQYQIDVDPNRLRTYNLPFSAVVAAVRDSNVNVGGNVLDANGAWLIVRGVGLIASVDDVRKIVVGASNGVPVYVEQVADVQIGNAFRVASLVKGTREAVGGVVVARTGVNTKQVIDAVKARITQIQSGLPAGVTIVPFYDRSDLIEQAVDTLRHALLEEIALVTLAHIVFLMHVRSILIVTIPLPLAVLHRVPRHVLRRHLLEHHEPCGHRDRHRRARRCRNRGHGERLSLRRAAPDRSARPPAHLG